MDDRELRLAALEVAAEVASETPGVDVVALAERFMVFLAGGRAGNPAAPKRGRHSWSDAGEDVLRRLYPIEPDMKRVCEAVREVENDPTLRRNSIAVKASALGLRRPSEAITPATRAMHAALAAKVRARTPEIDAEIIRLRASGTPQREIARTVGISLGGVQRCLGHAPSAEAAS